MTENEFNWNNVKPLDFINGTAPKFKCANAENIAVLEYREDEFVPGLGLFITQHSAQKFNQLGVLPKWRVVGLGDIAKEELGIDFRDIVIVKHMAGKLRGFGNCDLRFVNHKDVLAKVKYEAKDWAGLAHAIKQINNKRI